MAMALLAALGDDGAKQLLVRLATGRLPSKSRKRGAACLHAAGLLRSLGDAETLRAAEAVQEELGRVDVRFLGRVFDTVVPEVEFRVVCLLIARQNETSLKPMLKNLLESDGGFGAHLRHEFAHAEMKKPR
jgi:hypothetical protein